MIDALKRASAGSITAVIPYYGYARQDRKVAPRTPITAKLVADLIEAAGATRVVVDGPARRADPGLLQHPLRSPLRGAGAARAHAQADFDGDPQDVVVVSPDAGGVERARAYSKRLGASLAIIDKRRTKPNVAEVHERHRRREGQDRILLDDMIDTAGTLTQAANALMDKGATEVVAYATHAVLSGPAVERIHEEPDRGGRGHRHDPAHRRGAQACAKIKRSRPSRAPRRGDPADPPAPTRSPACSSKRLGERRRQPAEAAPERAGHAAARASAGRAESVSARRASDGAGQTVLRRERHRLAERLHQAALVGLARCRRCRRRCRGRPRCGRRAGRR